MVGHSNNTLSVCPAESVETIMTTEDCYLIASDDVLFSLSPETGRKPGDIQMMVAVFRWKDGEFFVCKSIMK